MDALVGYTGFVGSNLLRSHPFDFQFNSKNITDAYGLAPDLLVYSGVRAEKFLANANPSGDLEQVMSAAENIKKIAPKRLALISTVDVYPTPRDVSEDSPIEIDRLHPYGANRYSLENKVRDLFPDVHIIRLPGLYGTGIKKNFIYDLIHLIPSMLSCDKFTSLWEADRLIGEFYEKQENGFYQVRSLAPGEQAVLKQYFIRSGFTAVHFTDSRATFQFYGLSYLWRHIQTVVKHRIPLLNIATEPVSALELHRFITGRGFENHLSRPVPHYDFKTKYDALFGGRGGYLFNREFVLRDIQKFMQRTTE